MVCRNYREINLFNVIGDIYGKVFSDYSERIDKISSLKNDSFSHL